MGYFAGIKNLDDLKAKYRELCKLHHPDLGGDTATMQAINAAYRKIIDDVFIDFGQSTAEIEESLRDIIERTVVFEGLVVELCGRWVWFTGETYRWKSQLKALGCFFASKKKAWYWRPEDAAKTSKGKPLELDQIRSRYGSSVLESKKANCLA